MSAQTKESCSCGHEKEWHDGPCALCSCDGFYTKPSILKALFYSQDVDAMQTDSIAEYGDVVTGFWDF